MCSHIALLEALSKHGDDCYWFWVTNDTPFRLIRGEEANRLPEPHRPFPLFCSTKLRKDIGPRYGSRFVVSDDEGLLEVI